MKKKIKVGILFGGKSAEHEVSLQSAQNVMQAIDKQKYQVVSIGIDRTGNWFLQRDSSGPINAGANKEVALINRAAAAQLIDLSTGKSLETVDVVFPVLHGPFGEDGTIQGQLKLGNIPFVGAGILGSAVGMDKDVMKRLLRDAGLPIGEFIAYSRKAIAEINYDQITTKLGRQVFIKPANLGSSVGVSRADSREEFEAAVKLAFEYDNKIIVEEFIAGREIECSVLGNDAPQASLPGEILPQLDFYSYEAKYVDASGALLEAPAKLPDHIVKEIQDCALKTYSTLCCEGMARVDFFLKDSGEIIVNEINTIPGFTRISMYPKLWEASGITYTALIDQLIELALERFEQEQQLKTTFNI